MRLHRDDWCALLVCVVGLLAIDAAGVLTIQAVGVIIGNPLF